MVRGLVHQGPELIAQHSRQALGLAGTIEKVAKHALSIPKYMRTFVESQVIIYLKKMENMVKPAHHFDPLSVCGIKGLVCDRVGVGGAGLSDIFCIAKDRLFAPTDLVSDS